IKRFHSALGDKADIDKKFIRHVQRCLTRYLVTWTVPCLVDFGAIAINIAPNQKLEELALHKSKRCEKVCAIGHIIVLQYKPGDIKGIVSEEIKVLHRRKRKPAIH